jgi:hypothetical protein
MRILVAAFLLASPLAAQEAPRRLESLGVSCCTLRVRAEAGKAQGRYFGRPTPGRITLAPCKGDLCPPTGSDSSFVIPPNARIDMYAGRAVAKGLVIGAALGAVAVTTIWLGDQDLEQSAGGKIAAGIPIGGVLGGIVGGLVGALFPRWARVEF